MVGKKSSKRSTICSKGTNATIDQFFTIKRKSIENNSTSSNENETNITSSGLPSDIYKQQERNEKLSSQPTSAISSDKKENYPLNIKRQRRPLADIGGESTHTLTLMPTRKPTKPSFTVLRDDDIDQGTTPANKHETQTPQSPLSSPSNTDKSNTQQQQQQQPIKADNTTQQETSTTLDDNDDDDDDTQDSQASSPVGSRNSLQSFFDDDDDDNGIEFRVDALDSGDDDNNDSSTDDDATTSFFDDDDNDDDDEDDAPFLTKTHRRTHPPAATTTATTTPPSIPNKNRTLNSKNEDEIHNNMINKDNVNDGTQTPVPSTNTDDKVDQAASNTLEFSISNSLTIPLDIKDNYHSSSEEENDDDKDDDDDSRPEARTTPESEESTPSPVASNQQGSSKPTSPQLHCTQSSRASDLSTLSMSLPPDEDLDLHVAYPVPRGEHVIDKFGH